MSIHTLTDYRWAKTYGTAVTILCDASLVLLLFYVGDWNGFSNGNVKIDRKCIRITVLYSRCNDALAGMTSSG